MEQSIRRLWKDPRAPGPERGAPIYMEVDGAYDSKGGMGEGNYPRRPRQLERNIQRSLYLTPPEGV